MGANGMGGDLGQNNYWQNDGTGDWGIMGGRFLFLVSGLNGRICRIWGQDVPVILCESVVYGIVRAWHIAC